MPLVLERSHTSGAACEEYNHIVLKNIYPFLQQRIFNRAGKINVTTQREMIYVHSVRKIRIIRWWRRENGIIIKRLRDSSCNILTHW